MFRDDLDLTGRSRRRALARPSAKVAAAVLAAGLCVVGSATASFGAAARGHATTDGLKRADASSGFLACEVTDTGGINDRSFNASAYAGLKVAAAAVPGLTYKYLGSTSTSDYTPNINTFIGEKCGIIVTVGFDMAAATQTAAKKNPTQKFTIVDFTYSPSIKNVLGLYYATNQDAFMGGYLAAAMSKTGIVGTFGGQNIPPVTIYMDGWVAGVRYYNKINKAPRGGAGLDSGTQSAQREPRRQGPVHQRLHQQRAGQDRHPDPHRRGCRHHLPGGRFGRPGRRGSGEGSGTGQLHGVGRH